MSKAIRLSLLAGAAAPMLYFGAHAASSPIASSELSAVPAKISVPVYFLGSTGNPVPQVEIPRNLTIRLGAIPGSLGGTTDVALQTIHVGQRKTIQLDLADLTAQLGLRAAMFKETDGTPLELTPHDVRFARVSTGASSDSKPLTGLAVAFWDLEANGSLVPIYCDRPCQIHSSKNGNVFNFDAPSKGLAWLLSRRDKDSHFTHVRAVSPHPVIIIAPPEALPGISPPNLKR